MPHSTKEPNRGNVVLVVFPNSDLRTAKLRPALVVQADGINTGLAQVVVAMISSRTTRANHPSIRVKLAELDGDDWLDDDEPLTPEQKSTFEARLANIEQHPEDSIPWEEAKRRIEERLGK